jgi:hypothetical protein
MKNLFIAIGLVASFGFCGCDGDSSSNTNSGVSKEKALSDLSNADATQVSEGMEDYAEQKFGAVTKEQLCQFDGTIAAGMVAALDTSATDASVQQACTAAVTECGQSTSSPSASESTAFEPLSTDTVADCDATVGEYEACAKASTDEMVSLIKTLPACSELTVAILTSSAASVPEPAACKKLYTKCPGLQGDQ